MEGKSRDEINPSLEVIYCSTPLSNYDPIRLKRLEKKDIFTSTSKLNCHFTSSFLNFIILSFYFETKQPFAPIIQH